MKVLGTTTDTPDDLPGRSWGRRRPAPIVIVLALGLAAAIALALAPILLNGPDTSPLPAAGGISVYRVDAGGAGTTKWDRDLVESPAPYVNSTDTRVASTEHPIDLNHESVPAGTSAAVFQTERYDPDASVTQAEMEWKFAIAPGNYQVRLYFAEILEGAQAAGVREFDVSIEGRLVLDDYDIFEEVGGYNGVVKQFDVASDSTINIDFAHVKQNPVIQGIEIIQMSGATNTAPDSSPDPTQPRAAACDGTDVPAGADLHAIIDGASTQTFCLAKGTYDVGDTPLSPGRSVVIWGSGGSRSDFGAIDAPSRIVGSARVAIIEAGDDNTFRWLDVAGSNPGSACQADCGRGIRSGANTLVEYSRIHHNSNNGLGGGVPSNVTVRFSELDHNGMKDFKGTYGGVKHGATDNGGVLTVTDSYVHDNIGVGIWGDRCQQRMVAARNLIVRNSRDGIRWETDMPPDGCSNTESRSAVIHQNVVRSSGTDPTESGDAGIKIRNSPHADVAFNVTRGNEESGILVVYNGVTGANIGNRIHNNSSSDGIAGCAYARCSSNR